MKLLRVLLLSFMKTYKILSTNEHDFVANELRRFTKAFGFSVILTFIMTKECDRNISYNDVRKKQKYLYRNKRLVRK